MYMEQTSDWLTISEAMRALKVGRTTLYRWLKQGRLKAHRVGPKSVRIRRVDLERVITPAVDTGEEVPALKDAQPIPMHALPATIRPLTDEEQQRALAAVAASREFQARLLAKRGGEPFDESWPLIRASREERSERLR
jgi:excisionase family DNA binding protein